MCFWWLIIMLETDWDTFEPFPTPLGCEDLFFIAVFVKILCQNEHIWHHKGIAYKSLTNAQICSFWQRIFTNMAMQTQSSQLIGVENDSNMSKSVWSMIINHQKHNLDLYTWHKDHLEKTPHTPQKKKKFAYMYCICKTQTKPMIAYLKYEVIRCNFISKYGSEVFIVCLNSLCNI